MQSLKYYNMQYFLVQQFDLKINMKGPKLVYRNPLEMNQPQVYADMFLITFKFKKPI